MKHDVPIWEKENLTLSEASEVFGIGVNTLRVLSDQQPCDFVLWVGGKRLLKRRRLAAYLEREVSI